MFKINFVCFIFNQQKGNKTNRINQQLIKENALIESVVENGTTCLTITLLDNRNLLIEDNKTPLTFCIPKVQALPYII